MTDLEPVLIIPDTHAPYHDKRAYKLMLKAAQYAKVKHIYILGDFADFYSVMQHQKHPGVIQMLQDEVVDVLMLLNELDELFPKAQKVYIEGNHEFRLERYLIAQAPALFGITSVEHILEMHKRPNWKFVPYGPNQQIAVAGSKLVARHEPLASSAKATASKALCSLTYGHIHRIEESHIVGLDGSNHVTFSVGWLGDKRLDKVFSYVKGHHQWQLGFGLVYVDPSSGLFYHQKIHILEVNGKLSCVVNGRRFES